jgi:hypothetical protein
LSFRTRALFAVVSVSGAVAVCACSLLYENYDDRFAKTTTLSASDAAAPFFTANAAISHLTVASGNLYVATGSEILRLSEDGGAASSWWVGSGSSTSEVVALASNGSDTIVWSYGSPSDSKNSVFVSPTTSSPAATDVDDGSVHGDFLAARTQVAWSLGTDTTTCSACAVARLSSKDGAQQQILNYVPTAGDPKSGFSAKAISIDESGVDLLVVPAHFVRFDLSGNELCSNLGFTPTIAAIASAPSGSPTFLLYGTDQSQGALWRYPTNCPTLDGGVTLATDVSEIIGDDTAVYWSSSEGNIFRADLNDDVGDAGIKLGSAHAAPAALAVGDSWIYAAVSSSIFRFAKTP